MANDYNEVIVEIDQQASTVLRAYRIGKGVGLTKETPIFEEDEKTVAEMTVDETRKLIGALEDALNEETCSHCGHAYPR